MLCNNLILLQSASATPVASLHLYIGGDARSHAFASFRRRKPVCALLCSNRLHDREELHVSDGR